MLQALPSVPPTPLWLEIGKTVIGPLIAAIVVIGGLIWRDRIERRNVAQAWFEQTYITEGLDVLMGHLSMLRNRTIEPRRITFSEGNVSPMSPEVEWRIFTTIPSLGFLWGCETAEAIILSASRSEHPVVLTQDESNELMMYCGALIAFAETVRRILLGMTISSKKDIYKVHTHPKFKETVEAMEANFLNGKSLQDVNNNFVGRFAARLGLAAAALKKSKAK